MGLGKAVETSDQRWIFRTDHVCFPVNTDGALEYALETVALLISMHSYLTVLNPLQFLWTSYDLAH